MVHELYLVWSPLYDDSMHFAGPPGHPAF